MGNKVSKLNSPRKNLMKHVFYKSLKSQNSSNTKVTRYINNVITKLVLIDFNKKPFEIFNSMYTNVKYTILVGAIWFQTDTYLDTLECLHGIIMSFR